MDRSQRVVIIGAGIVGVNVADELVGRGWTNITVVEQGPLDMPGGSTSHAPGLVFQTNSSKTMTHLAKYTVKKLSSLKMDGQSCFNNVGGLEVATTPERMQELRRKHGFASSWGIEAKLVDADECLRIYPHLNHDKVIGGFFIPSDGLALAARAVQLLIERTRKAGVKYLDKTPVTGISQSNGRVTSVESNERSIPCDLVVSAAGFWGVEIGAMVDLRVPLLPLAHQYAKTTKNRTLAKSNPKPNWATLPILRHQDADLYYREHGDQYGIGYYGHKAMPVVAASLGQTPGRVDEHNMPSRLEFTPEDFAPAWKESQDLLPIMKETEIADGFNGIFSFTPDGGPIMGQHPTLDGFYVCEAVWVTHSAGMARALAQILTTGKSDIDVSECELSRFEDAQLGAEYVKETSSTNFDEVYDIIHPLDPKQSPRNIRVSPFYSHQQDLGAYFLDQRAWERPHWYEANAHLVSHLPQRWKPSSRNDLWSAKHYSPISAVEAHRTRTAVAMYDMTPLTRLDFSGPGAATLLQQVITRDLSRVAVGDITWALMLDPRGGIRTDVIIARVEPESFHVTVFSPAEKAYLQRKARWQRQTNPKLWVDVRDVTGGTCSVGIWGPRAEEVMRDVSSEDLSEDRLGYHRVKKAYIAGIPVTVMNLSHVGEKGWEIHTSAEQGGKLWEVLYSAGRPYGLVAAGRACLNSLRLEAGFKDFGSDFTTTENPFEAGLQELVDFDKQDDFVGRDAVHATSKSRPSRCLHMVVMDDTESVVLGKEPVFIAGKAAGYITSAGFGHTVGTTVAWAILPASIKDGQQVEVEYFGERLQATVRSGLPLRKSNAKQISGPEPTRRGEFQARL